VGVFRLVLIWPMCFKARWLCVRGPEAQPLLNALLGRQYTTESRCSCWIPLGVACQFGEVLWRRCQTERRHHLWSTSVLQSPQEKSLSVLQLYLVFFLFHTLAGWQSPLTRPQYSREFMESGITAVQCYDCPTAQCGSGHDRCRAS
jgi:hypothetical protein